MAILVPLVAARVVCPCHPVPRARVLVAASLPFVPRRNEVAASLPEVAEVGARVVVALDGVGVQQGVSILEADTLLPLKARLRAPVHVRRVRPCSVVGGVEDDDGVIIGAASVVGRRLELVEAARHRPRRHGWRGEGIWRRRRRRLW